MTPGDVDNLFASGIVAGVVVSFFFTTIRLVLGRFFERKG